MSTSRVSASLAANTQQRMNQVRADSPVKQTVARGNPVDKAQSLGRYHDSAKFKAANDNQKAPANDNQKAPKTVQRRSGPDR